MFYNEVEKKHQLKCKSVGLCPNNQQPNILTSTGTVVTCSTPGQSTGCPLQSICTSSTTRTPVCCAMGISQSKQILNIMIIIKSLQAIVSMDFPSLCHQDSNNLQAVLQLALQLLVLLPTHVRPLQQG